VHGARARTGTQPGRGNPSRRCAVNPRCVAENYLLKVWPAFVLAGGRRSVYNKFQGAALSARAVFSGGENCDRNQEACVTVSTAGRTEAFGQPYRDLDFPSPIAQDLSIVHTRPSPRSRNSHDAGPVISLSPSPSAFFSLQKYSQPRVPAFTPGPYGADRAAQ